MKLVVKVIEARNLLAMDLNGFSDPYVKLQIGKHNFKTSVVYKCLDPKWDQEFSCWVDDLSHEIVICVYDEDKYSADDFLGQVKIPISSVFDAEDKSLDTAWYSLQPKSKKSKNKDCGEICLEIFLSQIGSTLSTVKSTANEKAESTSTHSTINFVTNEKVESFSTPPTVKSYVNEKIESSPSTPLSGTPRSYSPFLDTIKSEVGKSESEDQPSNGNFDDVMQLMESRGQEVEVPCSLSGGVLLDQLYLIAPSDLNALLFSPDSKFPHDVANVQGKTELQFEPWKFEDDGSVLKRVATYINPATKLIKAVKAIEEQTYLKADSKAFAVFSTVSTPDVPYGSCFRVELLYCITSGPELQSGEQSSNLVISWRVNFSQSTMMKGMIENGAKQGLKMSFDQYAACLSENVNCVDMKDLSSTKEQILALVEPEPQSDWKLAFQYFANFTVVSTVLIVLYVLVHIWLAARSATRGLEFAWLDLPDSIVEVIVCGLLFFQVQRVLKLAAKFIQARKRSGSDHGIKACGDGWLLTVALIEGTNLPAVDATGSSDPYVVFTCHGKKRTSSIKFQKLEPRWNERFEFDAMEEPPSMLHIEVFDSDGPFGDAVSLGHAEINFLRTNIAELSDAWIPLDGKLSQAVQSKLHLRIFLDDNRCGNGVKDYIARMEKEVGKRINMRSPQTNTAFQKLFRLPAEEFLINDFSCQLKLKGKMPLQGRLFLSPRIIGFNANIFGQKTTLYILLVDIEDIQVAAATFSSMGSQVIAITLRKGRGQDARHGAYIEDSEGRLKFHFQSFVSFSAVHRTIMALWKARSLTPEQKVRIVEEESENKMLDTAESGLFVGIEDVNMSDVYSSTLVISSNSFMELFNGGETEQRVMERIGCLDYSCTPWELGETGMYLRQICYKFGKRISSYTGEVRSTQKKSSLPDKNGVLIEEIMTLNGVPYGDYFNLHLRYQAEETPSKPNGCSVKVSFGSEWLKTTSHQKRICKNIASNLQNLLKVMFAEAEKECASES